MTDINTYLNRPRVRGTWGQTERAAHEAWAKLVAEKPRSAQLLHLLLVAHMDRRGALVASHATLADLAGVSISTIKRAITDLVSGAWIQTVRIGSERGGALAYVINSRVAWADDREHRKYALFDAKVLASTADQEALDGPPLRKIPTLYPGEHQLPAGQGEEPPSLNGMEPDLPAVEDNP